jgi:hypothetical protein
MWYGMLKRVKRLLLFFIVITYLLFEELIWDRIAEPIYDFIVRLKLYEAFLGYIRESAGRYVVLALFVFPFALGEVLGVVSAMLVAKADIVAAIVVYLFKIPIAIVAFAILKAGKDKLESFEWFAKSYNTILNLIDKLKTSTIYTLIKEKLLQIKEQLKTGRHKILILLTKIYQRQKARK